MIAHPMTAVPEIAVPMTLSVPAPFAAAGEPRRSRIRRACAWTLLFVACAGVTHAATFASTRVTLDNGMRVVLAPDSLATALDASLWFAAGTRHEKPAQAGLALLAARLAFRAGSDDPLAPLAAHGGSGSLVVTPDFTSWSATVPASALDLALGFLAERTAAATTRPADLAAERAALRGERSRPDRTPVARALARLWNAAWPGHPYAQTGAPPPAGAESITPADVDAWRRTRFAPATGVLVLAGAFDPDSALAAVRKRFGGRPRAVPPAAPALPALRAASRGSERLELPVRLCLVGWRGPGAGDPDAAAFELLAAWLGGGPQARLARSLVNDWHLAVTAQAGYVAQRDGSLLWTMAVVAPDADSSAVETTLLDAAAGVARSAPEAFELERARRQLEAGALFALQTARQRAQALGEAEMLAGDAAAAARRLEALRAVTPADLQRAAARIMTDAGRATVWMLPANPAANAGGAR